MYFIYFMFLFILLERNQFQID